MSKLKPIVKRDDETVTEYKNRHSRERRAQLKGTVRGYQERQVRALREYYGITRQQYTLMLQAQDYRCLICQTSLTDLTSKNIHVDHCHQSGQVRGVLCSHCNHALGHIKDNPTTAYRMYHYLKENT